MKLYGLALAAIPQKDNPNIINVTCTSISLTDRKRESVEILKDLTFPTSFNVTNPQEAIDCFIKTTNVIDELVKRQEASISKYNELHPGKEIKYREVALQIGQTISRPINADIIHTALFGSSALSSKADILARRQQQLSSAIKGTAEKPKWSVDAKTRKLLTEISKSRTEFLAANPEYEARYKQACTKFSQLMGKCTLSWADHRTFDKPTMTHAPSELDLELADLKKWLDKDDKTAHIRLIQLARKQGKRTAEAVNSYPKMFGFLVPAEYAQDTALQDKYPSYCFYGWKSQYRTAFYEGYKIALDTPYSRHFKLPMDEQQPYFVDPCADLIIDQFQIIDKLRDARLVDDAPEWRARLSEASSAAAKRLSKDRDLF